MVRISRKFLFPLLFVSIILPAQASVSEYIGGFVNSLFWETKGQVQVASNLDRTPIYEPVVLQPLIPVQDIACKARSLLSYIYKTPKKTIAKDVIVDLATNPLHRVNLACALIGNDTHSAVMVISHCAGSLTRLKHYFGIGSDLLRSFRKGTAVSDSTMQSLVLLAAAAILIPKGEALPYPNYGSQKTCDLPTGSYLQSCTQSSATLFRSTDTSVPGDMCRLQTLCKTMYTGLPLQRNQFVYAYGDRVELGNNNGTLALISRIPGAKPSLNICKLLEGSYQQTCRVKLDPYISSDRTLASATLCRLIADCRTLSGRVHSNLKRIVHSYQLGRLENCDGQLVHHLASSLDGSCDGKSAEQIRRVAEDHKRYEL